MDPLTAPERAQIAVARTLVSAWGRLPERRFLRLFGRLLRRLPLPLPLEEVTRDGNVLDRQVQLVLALDALVNRGKEAGALPIARSRRVMDVNATTFAPEAPPLAAIEEFTVPGPAGPLRVRLYRPRAPGTAVESAGPLPALIYFHGGGWALGSLDSHDAPCRVLAARTPCAVLSVDYRLAPEHRFPAAVQDCAAAFRALAQRARGLGLDPARLAVGGDSAGGNLAAVTALQLRGDEVRPCFQLLIYPATDLTMSLPSIETFGRGFLLDRPLMEWYRGQYLPPGTDLRDPLGSPLHEKDLRGLPPAFVLTAGFDPLRDEGEAYARRLAAAGVPVRYECYRSLTHGFFNMSGTIAAAQAPFEHMVDALRAALAGR